MPIIGFIGYLTERIEKRWAKIALVPTLAIGFILGTVLPSVVFGMGMGVIALSFAERATYALVYFLLAGFIAFSIADPHGETSLPAMLISLATYVITVTIPKFGLFSRITIASLLEYCLLGLGALILIGSVFGIVKFLDSRIRKTTETEIE